MRLQYNGTRALNFYIGTDMPEYILARAQKKSNTDGNAILMLDQK